MKIILSVLLLQPSNRLNNAILRFKIGDLNRSLRSRYFANVWLMFSLFSLPVCLTM